MEEIDFSKLPKKERKKLKRELERQEREKGEKKVTIIKWSIVTLLILLVLLGGWWIVRELSKPLPGQAVPDQGRQHVSQPEWEKFSYNSNPPTSGSHDKVWTKAKIYDESQGDGHVVHSLEHGYIVISYNCDKNLQECQDLKNQLSDLAKEKRVWKLIIVPRPNLDARIALTAWGRIDKMNVFDKQRIAAFIDAFRDKGPEKTME